MALLPIIGAIIGVLGVVYIYMKHVSFKYWSSRGVAQVEPIVPIGSVWPVITGKKSFGELMRDTYLEFRFHRFFGIYFMNKSSLVIADPDLIRFVLTKEFEHFPDRGMHYDEKVDPMSGNIFLIGAKRWKYLRSKFTPTFTSGKIKYMFAALKKCIDNLEQYMAEEVASNDLIEITEVLAGFTTDVIASAVFGIESNSLRNPNTEFCVHGREFYAAHPIRNAIYTLCPSVMSLLRIRFFGAEISNYFIGIIRETIEYRKAQNVVRKDFLQLVMQLMDKGYVDADEGEESGQMSGDANRKVTLLEGAAQAFGFWLAGFENASVAATYCLYELAVNEEIQEKLADEIDEAVEKYGGISYESIAEMPYLQKVVSETMRKYPPLPGLTRVCTQAIDLLDTGLRIEKGTLVIVPVLGLHWDPDIYPEPDKFDPERFSQENIARRHRYTYLPFGEGPRNCIGLKFALVQVKLAIVILLSKYHFSPGPDTKVPLPLNKGSFIHSPAGSVTLRVKKRS